MLEKNKQMKWLTVRQLANTYPCFTESSLRWLIFNQKMNGLQKCIRKINKRILINAESFEDWVESHQQGGAHNEQ